MQKRGFYGLMLYRPKTESNLGAIIRSAYNFEANFISTVGNRYHRQAFDTTNATNTIPLFHYHSLESWFESIPINCWLIPVEVNGAYSLEKFVHPERAIYIFGGEDLTLPKSILELPRSSSVRLDTRQCMNLASIASIVMYDRYLKGSMRFSFQPRGDYNPGNEKEGECHSL